MNPLDHFVQRQLHCPAYLRYVDDFALFSNSKSQLYEWKAALIERLAAMRLTLHEAEAQVLPTKDGIPWLGFVVYPSHRHIKPRNATHFRQRLERNIDLYENGSISFAELDASVQGWINHVRYADTWRLRGDIFDAHPIKPHPQPEPKTLPKRLKKPLYRKPKNRLRVSGGGRVQTFRCQSPEAPEIRGIGTKT
jgi:hypothetical protein